MVKLFLAVSNFQDLDLFISRRERGSTRVFGEAEASVEVSGSFASFRSIRPFIPLAFFPKSPLIAPSSLQLSAQH